jgi:3-hydroxyacyl-[acyl-carrier-protein] dehydratase
MTQQVQLPIDVNEIRALLPHRYPFLLVDRVVEFEAHKRVLGIKNVTINEPFFQGHFPAQPVMPGVLVIEALAQAGGLLTQLSYKVDGTLSGGKLFYLVKIDNAKFSKMVVPGDRLELDVELKRTIRNMALYSGVARVDGEQVACAEILCAEVKS